MIVLKVDNSRTSIHNAGDGILSILDAVLRYPSDIAITKAAYVELPEELNAWDGWVRLLHRPKTIEPWFSTGLLAYVIDCFNSNHILFNILDSRIRPVDNMPELVDIPLRDYQKEAADIACNYGRGVLDMVPRSGKTRIACEIQRQLNRKTLWIAPTREILIQTKRVLDSFFYNDYSYILKGSSGVGKATGYPVVLSTPNTAYRLNDNFYKSRDCIIIDEFHRAAASMYHTIFKKCDHIYYRFGMTGTFFRSGEDVMSLHAHISNTLYKVDSDYLLSRGFLVPTYVVYVPVPGKLKVGQNAYQKGHGKYGIWEHQYRNQLASQLSILLSQTGRSVLVLVATIEQGNLIKNTIKSFLDREDYGRVEFVHGSTKAPIIKQILKSFVNKDTVQILIGTSVLGEGVDLPTADSLVYAMGQKAEVSLTQNAYRVGTACEGKTHAILVDFADRHHKKLLKHSLERVRVYNAEPTFNVSVLDKPEDFSGWLNNLKYKAY